MSTTIKLVPDAPTGYSLAGKHVMVHDITAPDVSDTVRVPADQFGGGGVSIPAVSVNIKSTGVFSSLNYGESEILHLGNAVTDLDDPTSWDYYKSFCVNPIPVVELSWSGANAGFAALNPVFELGYMRKGKKYFDGDAGRIHKKISKIVHPVHMNGAGTGATHSGGQYGNSNGSGGYLLKAPFATEFACPSTPYQKVIVELPMAGLFYWGSSPTEGSDPTFYYYTPYNAAALPLFPILTGDTSSLSAGGKYSSGYDYIDFYFRIRCDNTGGTGKSRYLFGPWTGTPVMVSMRAGRAIIQGTVPSDHFGGVLPGTVFNHAGQKQLVAWGWKASFQIKERRRKRH